jgi:hypothetical protein
MIFSQLLQFNRTNRRMLLLLVSCHVVWFFLVVSLWAIGSIHLAWTPVWHVLFALLQLYAASQLILPALLMVPEQRSRVFYLFWVVLLSAAVWTASLYEAGGAFSPFWQAFRSGLLLFVATITGAALARYVKRPWEIVPICFVMTLADFLSWLKGPTAVFSDQIRDYYSHPVGPPPVVDVLLVKLAAPGIFQLSPVFGVSDWIMVVFFAVVAHRHSVNDNLFVFRGEDLARKGLLGAYLPVPVVALIIALVMAYVTKLFVPALPVVALVMLSWYLMRKLFCRS